MHDLFNIAKYEKVIYEMITILSRRQTYSHCGEARDSAERISCLKDAAENSGMKIDWHCENILLCAIF